MQVTKLHYGHVEKGKFIPDNMLAFKQTFWMLEGRSVTITVDKQRRKRSQDQNRYYWGVIIDTLARAIGYTPNEMHEALKWKFLRTRTEETLPTVKSTTLLNTEEFNEYIAQIQQFASTELSVYIPDPGECQIIGGY